MSVEQWLGDDRRTAAASSLSSSLLDSPEFPGQYEDEADYMSAQSEEGEDMPPPDDVEMLE